MNNRKQGVLLVLVVGLLTFAWASLGRLARPDRTPLLFDDHWKTAALLAVLAMFYAAFGRD